MYTQVVVIDELLEAARKTFKRHCALLSTEAIQRRLQISSALFRHSLKMHYYRFH